MSAKGEVLNDPGLVEGRPVLLVIDILQGCFDSSMPGMFPGNMQGYVDRMHQATSLIQDMRNYDVPIIFFQEAHRPNHVDFGRELDGSEGIHCLENDPNTAIATQLGMRATDYFIRKRRYSCFFGTDLEILLKGLRASTLILIGGLTDVCVHFTFVDGHQHDYYCRVVEDCVAGSSLDAHEAALNSMQYLQRKARCSSQDIIQALSEFRKEAS